MSKALDVCKKLMESIAKNGFTNQIHKRELERIIFMERGIDKRTVNNWIRALERFGFIKPLTPLVYGLDFSQIPELLNLIIDTGQKKLM